MPNFHIFGINILKKVIFLKNLIVNVSRLFKEIVSVELILLKIDFNEN